MAASPQDSIETRYGWIVIIVSTLMMATGFGGTYLVVVGLKPIAAEFDWPRSLPSLAYSMTLLGAGLGGIVMGLWSDRRGMGGPALLGGIMVGVGAILAGNSQGIVLLLLAHGLALGFLGNGSMFSPLLTNATRWFDRRRGVAVAIVASGQSLAGAIWPPLFRYSMDAYGWRETMMGYGVLAMLIMVPLSFLLRRQPPQAVAGSGGRADAPDQGPVLGLPPGLVQAILCLGVIGCCVAMAMPMVHVVAYCSDLGFAAARGAEMLSLLLACAFLSRIAFGLLADRIGGLNTILLGASFQAVTLSLYIWIDSLAGLYLVSALFGLGFGGIVPSYALAVRELFPVRQAGWRIGIVFFFGTVGMSLGGFLGGFIFDLAGGYSYAFMTGVAFNVVNLALIGSLVWRHRVDPRSAMLQAA